MFTQLEANLSDIKGNSRDSSLDVGPLFPYSHFRIPWSMGMVFWKGKGVPLFGSSCKETLKQLIISSPGFEVTVNKNKHQRNPVEPHPLKYHQFSMEKFKYTNPGYPSKRFPLLFPYLLTKKHWGGYCSRPHITTHIPEPQKPSTPITSDHPIGSM